MAWASGMNGMLVLALLAVFIAGLMVGRTPEYLGKKIQATEVKLVVMYILAMPVAVLVGAGIAIVTPSVLNVTIWNPGPHGFSEMLYAFTSAGNNNGSAFAGITANTQFMNTALGIAMLIGRFFLIIPTLALAGALARKEKVPASAGTFPTHTPLFAGLLIGVIVIVAGAHVLPGARARSHRRAARSLGGTSDDFDSHDHARRDQGRAGPYDRLDADGPILRRAVGDSFVKLNPRHVIKQPGDVRRRGRQRPHHDLCSSNFGSSSAQENVFAGLVAAFLWFTVLFANFAEAVAEGRGKAQADTLRKTRAETMAHRRRPDGTLEEVPGAARSTSATRSWSCAGEVIPSDGDVVRGDREHRRVGDHR